MIRAAALLAVCEAPLSILWARRGHDAPVLPSFHALPGGAIHPSDARAPSDGGDDLDARVAALRELFEELGILAVRGDVSDAVRAQLRDLFADDAEAGHARMRALGLAWRTSELVPVGRWITPKPAPDRSDVRFYALRFPAPVEPDPDLFEMHEPEWITPERAIARWGRAEVMIMPPVAAMLRSLAKGAFDPGALRAVYGANGEEAWRWEPVPHLQMLPLRTPTLPPATHTSSFLAGSGQALIVEPASPYAEELDRMIVWIDESRAAGIEPVAIFATHHHVDHISGAIALKERLGLPLWGHALTAQRLERQIPFDRLIEDGERIELEGPEPMVLRAVHTPGHAPGHLCLIDERSRAMIAGDMVAGVGTILIEPTDGDMELYLASLRRMADEEPSILLPAHGLPIRDPRAALERYVAHRLMREAKVLDALKAHDGPATAADLLPRAYDDAPLAVWPLAALSAEAHLIKLEREGRVRRAGSAWSA